MPHSHAKDISENTLTHEDVKRFETAVKRAKRTAPIKRRPSEEEFSLQVNVNGHREVAPTCKVKHRDSTLGDSEDLIFTDHDYSKTACGNAIQDFEEAIDSGRGDI